MLSNPNDKDTILSPNAATTNAPPEVSAPQSFAPPAHIVGAILKGIDVGRPDLAANAFTKLGLLIDTFVDTDVAVPEGERMPRVEGAGPVRIVSVTGLQRHGCLDLLIALPADHFAAVDAAELALRILASGEQLKDMSAFTVETPSGLELVLFGAVDRSTDAPATDFVIAWNVDAPTARVVSTTIH